MPTPASSSPPVDCIVCGTCVADMLVRPVPLTQPLGAGRLFLVEPIELALGGIVCNSGTGLRRLGMRVAASSLVGNDLWGAEIRRRLEAEGIATDSLQTHPTLATSTTAALIDPSGERSFAHHVGAPQAIDLPFILKQRPHFATARLALLGYVGLLPGLEPVLAGAVAAIRSAGCRVALETGGSGGTLAEIAPCLPLVDIYVPSLLEASHQTGLEAPRGMIECYREQGATGFLGIKLGTRGTLLSPAPDEWLDIPCLPAPAPVIDTTGAGDAFLAGLLAGWLRGLPAREAGLLGAATAACCVTARGATAGLKDFAATAQLAGLQSETN